MRRPYQLARKVAGLVKLAAFAGHQGLGAAGRLVGLARPADVAVGPAELFRTDALWLSALAAAGTVHVPPARLLRLARGLDLAGYLRVLRRCRAGVGPRTVRVVDAGGPRPPADAPAVSISHDYYGPGPGGPQLDCPYPLHPWFYMTGTARRVARLRAGRRRFKLVFAGARGYPPDRPGFGFRFPLLPRTEIVDRVLKRFADRALVVSRPDQVPELARTDRPIVLVLHDPGPPGEIPEPLLPPAEFVRLLAAAEFALCPPGLVMPHSHNLIEAMAVGTVPVLNYAGWCRPRLTPGRDCLGFDTLDELDAAVGRALAAPAAEVDRLRAAVGRLYDDEYDPAGFAGRLGAFVGGPEPGATVAVNVELHTAELWAARNLVAGPPGGG